MVSETIESFGLLLVFTAPLIAILYQIGVFNKIVKSFRSAFKR